MVSLTGGISESSSDLTLGETAARHLTFLRQGGAPAGFVEEREVVLNRWSGYLQSLCIPTVDGIGRHHVDVFLQAQERSGVPRETAVATLQDLYSFAVMTGGCPRSAANALLAALLPEGTPGSGIAAQSTLGAVSELGSTSTPAPVPARSAAATVGEVIDRYLACLQSDRGSPAATAKNYETVLRRLQHYLKCNGVERITGVDRVLISGFIAVEKTRMVRGEPVKTSTVAHGKDVVRAFGAWCVEMEVLPSHVAAHLHTKRKERTPTVLRPALLVPQVDACVAVARTPRDALLVLMLALTGSRLSAALSARVRDWNPYTHHIVVSPKREAPVALPICAALGEQLSAYISGARLDRDDYIFASRQTRGGAPKPSRASRRTPSSAG